MHTVKVGPTARAVTASHLQEGSPSSIYGGQSWVPDHMLKVVCSQPNYAYFGLIASTPLLAVPLCPAAFWFNIHHSTLCAQRDSPTPENSVLSNRKDVTVWTRVTTQMLSHKYKYVPGFWRWGWTSFLGNPWADRGGWWTALSGTPVQIRDVDTQKWLAHTHTQVLNGFKRHQMEPQLTGDMPLPALTGEASWGWT